MTAAMINLIVTNIYSVCQVTFLQHIIISFLYGSLGEEGKESKSFIKRLLNRYLPCGRSKLKQKIADTCKT